MVDSKTVVFLALGFAAGICKVYLLHTEVSRQTVPL